MQLDLDAEVQLCRPEVGDAEDLFRVVDANRDHLFPWLPWVPYNKTTADSRAFLQDAAQKRARGEGCNFLIRERGAIRGMIGLDSIDAANDLGEIGYWLSREAQGRGLMTISLEGLVRHAFEAHSLNRLQLRAAVQNVRSRAVATRVGFSQEGVLREVEKYSEGYVDLVIYSLLRREFECQNESRRITIP